MYELDRDALDRYITSGRYEKNLLVVTCPKCGEETPVTEESEYGTAEWSPGGCKCGHEFDGTEEYCDDEPPEIEPDFPDPDPEGPWS